MFKSIKFNFPSNLTRAPTGCKYLYVNLVEGHHSELSACVRHVDAFVCAEPEPVSIPGPSLGLNPAWHRFWSFSISL